MGIEVPESPQSRPQNEVHRCTVPVPGACTSPPPAFMARATANYGRGYALLAFARARVVCDG